MVLAPEESICESWKKKLSQTWSAQCRGQYRQNQLKYNRRPPAGSDLVLRVLLVGSHKIIPENHFLLR